ncbi:MAG TPA: hypothetical protein VGC76_05405 [Pyrinomonadaceae bacterium]
MLILLTILVVLSAVITISVVLKTQKDRKLLSSEIPREIESPVQRSLFEPSAEDIRLRADEEKSRIETQKAEDARLVFAQKAEKVREFREFWELAMNRRNTVQLLRLAAESESGKIFSETAESVIDEWHANKIEDLSAEQLAQILESHFWLLPDKERTSGVAFWLKQEIAGLRRKLVGKN